MSDDPMERDGMFVPIVVGVVGFIGSLFAAVIASDLVDAGGLPTEAVEYFLRALFYVALAEMACSFTIAATGWWHFRSRMRRTA